MDAQLISTVTTQAASYILASLSDIKDELGIADNSKDALLQRYLTSVSAAVAQYCNRVFQAETVTDSFWAQRDRWPHVRFSGIQILQLSRWPIISVASITENGTALVQDTDFKIVPTDGQLIRLDSNGYPRLWPVWPIVISYTAGYATIPTDVQDAVIRMVTARYATKGRDRGLKQQNIPGVIEQSWWIATGTDSGNMTPDITDILDNYRVPVTA